MSEQHVALIPMETIGSWPTLRAHVPDASVQEAAQRDRALKREMNARLRILERHEEQAAERTVAEANDIERAVGELSAWLNYLQDWGLERAGVSLSDWEMRDAQVDRLREQFGRLIGRATRTQAVLADPLAAMDDMERRFPALRRPVPTYLKR